LFNHLLVHVKPERDTNRRETRRENWWLFGENAPMFRRGSIGLSRYVATCRTSKHRLFTFVDINTIPDAKIVAIAIDDAFFLGVLSSRADVVWAAASGAWLGVGNDSNYNHSECFGKFPFPDSNNDRVAEIRKLGEELESHRKRQQTQNPDISMTYVYNALEKLRNGNSLNANKQLIHNKALVSVLKQIHDDLDAAVFDAFGWPHDLTDEEILQRLVDLNRERAEEEARGVIRWLRPEFQNPKAFKAATKATSAAEAGSSGTGWNLRASQRLSEMQLLPCNELRDI
jgi:hypothetical protein